MQLVPPGHPLLLSLGEISFKSVCELQGAFLVVPCSKSERTTNHPTDSAARPILGPMWRPQEQRASSLIPPASNPYPTPPFTSWSLMPANPCPHLPLSPKPRNWRGEAHLITADASLSAPQAGGQTPRLTALFWQFCFSSEVAVVSLKCAKRGCKSKSCQSQTSSGLWNRESEIESMKSGITAPIFSKTTYECVGLRTGFVLGFPVWMMCCFCLEHIELAKQSIDNFFLFLYLFGMAYYPTCSVVCIWCTVCECSVCMKCTEWVHSDAHWVRAPLEGSKYCILHSFHILHCLNSSVRYSAYCVVCIPNITGLFSYQANEGMPQLNADVHVCIMFLSEVPYMSFGNGIGMQMGACVYPQCMLGVGVCVLCLWWKLYDSCVV